MEQGPSISITGNLITLFKELSTTNADWKARLATEHSRGDQKYDQIYQKVYYFTRSVGVPKKFLSAQKPISDTNTPSFKEDTESAQSIRTVSQATAAGNFEAPTTTTSLKPLHIIEMADETEDDPPMSQPTPITDAQQIRF